MILILGGTTEGRRVAEVCDEAQKNYFYSTKGNLQQVDLVHGTHISGILDTTKMTDFCKLNDIKLIVDAAHPFAEVLHQTIANVSQSLDIPVVRYERQYQEHNSNAFWFDSYNEAIEYLEHNKIDYLLALTGVNTIAKLKSYWQKHNTWFRILDRDESREIVIQNNYPVSKVLYYKQGEDETPLYQKLNPGAIITKESGESGGFAEKIKTANKLGIPILVVKRPKLSPSFIAVYGQYGLRKQIENLIPDFFELKTGYTTGTCATAATKAALIALITNNIQEKVSITLPSGEQVSIPIESTVVEGREAFSVVLKDAGDDPDVTHGKQIVSTVRITDSHKGVRFLQGHGVGKVTLPGLGIEIGEPAINKTPRMMMKQEVYKVFRHYEDKLPNGFKIGIDITISVPDGEKIALKTFNPRLGIVGGISIIGTSGVVKPFSSDAFIGSICREMQVAKALGCKHIVINSGAKSERYIKQEYPDFCNNAFVHYGNFIGKAISIASDIGFEQLTLSIMLGKAVKLAEGFLDTHSKKVVMNKEFISEIARSANCSDKVLCKIQTITMARQLWNIIPKENHQFFSTILDKCRKVCTPLFPKGKLIVMLIDDDGKIIK